MRLSEFVLISSSIVFVVLSPSRCDALNPPRKGLAFLVDRGGSSYSSSFSSSSSSAAAAAPPPSDDDKNQTLQEYVTAMEEKDKQHDVTVVELRNGDDNGNDSADSDNGLDNTSTTTKQPEGEIVGVKSKKSNAVGDPDDDDDDDDDDEVDNDDELEEEEDDDDDDNEVLTEWEEVSNPSSQALQVEVEVVEEIPTAATRTSDSTTASNGNNKGNPRRSGGGVGVRLGRRQNKLNRQNNKRQKVSSSTNPPPSASMIAQAWLPHLYLPPTPEAWEKLTQSARSMDAASKSRLDRRTLYGNLLLELAMTSSAQNTSPTTSRRFFAKETSQKLRASLSMATQPQWRTSFPDPSGVLLYDPSKPGNGVPTLAMQETIAMSLAHSLDCGFVVIDDVVLSMVRQHLVQQGSGSASEDDLKPAALLDSLLSMAKAGQLLSSAATSGDKTKTTTTLPMAASIADDMESDLQSGLLEDPFDDRAIRSVASMREWEWKPQLSDKPLPLVVFVRTSSATSLLKSKSAVEYLMQETTSDESIHLLVLGKGIDATTSSLPAEPVPDLSGNNLMNGDLQSDGQPPWFGFSPQNQNASGQNDPEGSRRFNIFLARTVDGSGQPGILGAIAPPQAGNLFPHMMAMQAKERLDNMDNNDAGADMSIKAELERWAELASQQVQNSGTAVPPPQFFNASLASPFGNHMNPQQNVPPEIVQQALQQAMSELLDRLARMEGEGDDLQKAFSQLLKNENLRRGIAENLSRAAPALTDPKCQGVMLSVYVPPMNRPKPGWFQKILNNDDTDKKKRVRTLAAAAAMQAAQDADNTSTKNGSSKPDKAERNLAKLEGVCRRIPVDTPTDPVRAKSWDAWINRERGAVLFRQNRIALQEEMSLHSLELLQNTGSHGAGSALRQMLSVRDVTEEMFDVIKCAVELEAAKSQKLTEEINESDILDIDITLSQLLVGGDEVKMNDEAKKVVHPSSIESALSLVCHISPSPSGALSLTNSPAAHRSREEIANVAQDKHERALISQVVLPQDIGVTYDMIGGLSAVKELLRQSITYPLKFPHLYSEGIAREAVKGVLLFGPPGTGKTMLAKAVATEGGASFLSVDASSVENKWLGESEKNAKAVFTLARRLAPCVIFIDEVDSLLSSREGSSDDSAHGTLTSVKTTMMSEWDGLNSGINGNGETGSDRVIVIGSTNRPFDLDEAVLRRFPRRILVDLPDLETRTEILEVTLAENRLDPAVNLTDIAERLDGYTGSDIKEVCREAVVQISHEQARMLDEGGGITAATAGAFQRLRPVTMDDFEKALSKLKRSVSETGRELARVWEWNDEYGEIKKEKKNQLPQLMNMYL